MLKEAQSKLPLESGGVLLGATKAGRIEIIHAVGPGPLACHEATGFTPDREWQYDEIARLYEESGSSLEYLGDWHTHPYGTPRPSSLDMSLLKQIAGSAESMCPRPIMVILAYRADEWTAGIHIYQRSKWWWPASVVSIETIAR
jgi:integrative and conjugative element protein (TIGR02256 family)